MQPLNVFNNKLYPFNTFSTLNARNLTSSIVEKGKPGLRLLEQLQTTLDLDKLLNIFAMEAARYVKFSGLYFKSKTISKSLEGSKKARNERQFELKINNEFIGNITYSINKPISMANYKILEQLHQYLVYPLKNSIAYHHIMNLAMHDGLTNLGNRRYFDEQLKRAMHNANRHQTHVGLVLSDLNKFKPINDTYGHAVGDQVLQGFSKVLIDSIRDSDSVFRFGGDEFAIIVENASEHALDIIDDRINFALKTNVLMAKYNVSCSLGKTFMNRGDNESSIFDRADQDLYLKKMHISKHLSLV